MGMIPEVKCRRCGTTFSAMRSRCPNCGTRRVTQSSRTPGTTPGTVRGTASYERAETNTRWQMIFGLILVVAVILAVIVMVSGTLSGIDNQTPGKASMVLPSDSASIPTFEEPPTPSPTVTPSVENIEIWYYNITLLGDHQDPNTPDAYSPLLRVGEDPLRLTWKVYPANVAVSGDQVHWSSSDPDVIEITNVNDDGTCDITALQGNKPGGVLISVEIFGVTKSCRIYVGEAQS